MLKMIDISRYEYIRKAFLLEKHYVETNNGITFFAHQLAQLSQVCKIAWLWNETNSFIHEFKKDLPGHRVITVTAEELFKDTEVMAGIFKFLNLSPIHDRIVDKFLARKVNKQRNKIILNPVQVDEVLSNTPLRDLYFKT